MQMFYVETAVPLTSLRVVVQFERNDSYQGFASAMPPREREVKRLQPLALAITTAKAGMRGGFCGTPEGMP